jgi:hypothetical protein
MSKPKAPMSREESIRHLQDQVRALSIHLCVALAMLEEELAAPPKEGTT